MVGPDSLRVAVDATALLGTPTGVGAVTRRILSGLAAAPGYDPSAYAVSWRGRDALADAVPPGVRIHRRALPARPATALWRRFDRPVIDHWIGRVDVVHGPNFVVPPSRQAGTVATVHDLTAVHHPELCTDHARTYPDHIAAALARGAWVHTPSAFVRDEVIRTFDADPDRVVHVPNGVEQATGSPTAAPADLADRGPYVLALGTVEPRKGLPDLVRAFDITAVTTPLTLVVAGPDGWGTPEFDDAVASARHRDRIVRLGWLDDDARAGLVAGARMLAYPSVYEGFGLPPLEAMAVDVPVVSSAAGGLAEVVGDAAQIVTVGDIDGLATAMATVHDDHDRRAELIAAGRDRVRAFPWRQTTDGLLALYRRVAAG